MNPFESITGEEFIELLTGTFQSVVIVPFGSNLTLYTFPFSVPKMMWLVSSMATDFRETSPKLTFQPGAVWATPVEISNPYMVPTLVIKTNFLSAVMTAELSMGASQITFQPTLPLR